MWTFASYPQHLSVLASFSMEVLPHPFRWSNSIETKDHLQDPKMSKIHKFFKYSHIPFPSCHEQLVTHILLCHEMLLFHVLCDVLNGKKIIATNHNAYVHWVVSIFSPFQSRWWIQCDVFQTGTVQYTYWMVLCPYASIHLDASLPSHRGIVRQHAGQFQYWSVGIGFVFEELPNLGQATP